MTGSSHTRSTTRMNKRLAELSEWTLNKQGTQLSKSYDFGSYVEGLAFLARIVVYAEVLQHRPELEFRHNRVRVKIGASRADRLTARDLNFAKKIDRVASR